MILAAVYGLGNVKPQTLTFKRFLKIQQKSVVGLIQQRCSHVSDLAMRKSDHCFAGVQQP